MNISEILAVSFIIVLLLAVLAGGLISLFAGRKLYAVWLGFATFVFADRILDVALGSFSDVIRNGGGLLIAVMVVIALVLLRDRVARFIPFPGGFIVGALVAERFLGFVFPEAGKYLFFIVLATGGLVGLFIFRNLLNIDDTLIVLSALWGASFVSKGFFDFIDMFLISLNGVLGSVWGGFLDSTLLLQTLLWFGLAIIGILVQRRQKFKPIAVREKAVPDKPPRVTDSPTRRNRILWGLVGGILALFLLATVLGSNFSFAKSLRTSLANLEKSMGLEAGAPGDAPWEWATTLLRPQVELQNNDRILVLVPHPDDDILSTSGLIKQALKKNLPVQVVFFTNGDYNEVSFSLYRKEITLSTVDALRLGETRREEALAAEGILGVKPEQVIFLGYPDGGGLEIFEKHWGDNEPYRALLSGETSVPYTFAQTPQAPFKGESIVTDIEKVIQNFQPTKIFTSHPGDVHPDHQTLPLYLQIALWDLKDEIHPEVYHFITHYGRWPQPRGYQPEHPLDPPAQFDIGNRWLILPLTSEEREKKLQALKAHKTQWESGQEYLESVVRANELFDVLSEISVSTGEEVQILPAQMAFNGEALMVLPESDQAKFTESEVRSVKLDGDGIVFAVESAQPLSSGVHASVWVIGYRSDTSFGDMPKIFMDLSENSLNLSDRGKTLPADAIKINSTPTRSEVRISLNVLGNPERVMLSAQTSVGEVTLDNIPWVFLRLP
jgi:LmbE family N-acetylglucosaminyl deacetylase